MLSHGHTASQLAPAFDGYPLSGRYDSFRSADGQILWFPRPPMAACPPAVCETPSQGIGKVGVPSAVAAMVTLMAMFPPFLNLDLGLQPLLFQVPGVLLPLRVAGIELHLLPLSRFRRPCLSRWLPLPHPYLYRACR
jgi:hypothetical protein